MTRVLYGVLVGLFLAHGAAHAQIKVVDMIPNSLSNESSQDSEGNLAVDLSNLVRIAGSAFTTDPSGLGGTAPIYVSTDGGNTWTLNPILPSPGQTNDTSIRFAGTDGILYSGIITVAGSGDMLVLRTTDFTSNTVMTQIDDVPGPDQPFIQTTTVRGWYDPGKDRVYVGNNAASATVTFSLDAAIAAPAFTNRVTDNKTGVAQDAPSIRPAIHLDGTIYAAFMRLNSISINATGEYVANLDVVVVRDDNWGNGANPFSALMTGTTLGVNVVSGRTVALVVSHSTNFGQERYGSELSIAVDPNDHRTVYIAWGDRVGTEVITLHVRRSTTAGATWEATDLVSVTNAKNPSLAVNSQGKLAFLYQGLETAAGTQRWVTHFRRLSGGSFDDTRLHSAPANTPTADPTVGTYLGDYTYMMAVGKDYYGIFTGNNTPDKVNDFPDVPAANVTYQRNVDFGTAQLRNATNTANVPVSIDPFFFKSVELPPASDFYVRDWNDGATSFDTGLEPSTHQNFFSTSDVWNQYSNVAPAPNSFVQPTSSDAQTSNLGDNYAFARIGRNASGTTEMVTAHFMIANGGVGVNFVDANSAAADPTVSFGSADLLLITPAFQWDVATVNPNHHLCLAVQISTSSDPFIPPSLVGLAPGWPNADLNVINDNNKAQRNMASTGLTMGNHSGFSQFFLAHNAATETRDMIIGYDADPAVLRGLSTPTVEVVGGDKRPFQPHDTIVLPKMAPGENRWIGLGADRVTIGKAPIQVAFYELVGSHPVNGYAVELRPAKVEVVQRATFKTHVAVFEWLADDLHVAAARTVVESARRLARGRGRVPAKEYEAFFATHGRAIDESAQALLRAQNDADPFRVGAALSELHKARGVQAMLDAHARLLERMSANVEMLELARGDRADILQTVAWQRDLFIRSAELKELPAAGVIARASQEFISSWGAGRVRDRDYSRLLGELLDGLRATAHALEKEHRGLETAVDSIANELAGSPAAVQHAHRELLLKLEGK